MKDWLPLATAALGFVTVLIGWRIIQTLKLIRIELDGRLGQLLALTAKSSKAEGALQEKEKDDARSD